MDRARRTASATLRGPVLAGAMALSGPLLVGCQMDDSGLSQTENGLWFHDEGERNTDMVQFVGYFASECAVDNPRLGTCSAYDAIIKLRVKPVQGADLYWKRAGVEWRNPSYGTYGNAPAYYFTTYGDGYEEWHAPVRVSAWNDLLVFDAWYQDGALHTFYDDNNGESHAIEDADNNSSYTQVLRYESWLSDVALTDYGVSGTVSARAIDLDWDKELYMVATVDGWQTILEFHMGAPGDTNAWYWVEDTYSGGERWQIDLDIPGDYQELEFAMRYRHGIVNYAQSYDFWANNGGSNFRVQRANEVP